MIDITRKICICGLLIALSVCFKLFSIPIFTFGGQIGRLGFGEIPIMLSGAMFGIIYGSFTGIAADLIYSFSFLNAPYIPFMTLTSGLLGFIFALFFLNNKQRSLLRIVLAVIVTQAICSILNTLILSEIINIAFDILFIQRIIPLIISILFNMILLSFVIKLYYKKYGVTRC